VGVRVGHRPVVRLRPSLKTRGVVVPCLFGARTTIASRQEPDEQLAQFHWFSMAPRPGPARYGLVRVDSRPSIRRTVVRDGVEWSALGDNTSSSGGIRPSFSCAPPGSVG
jgi:hypothetical protein